VRAHVDLQQSSSVELLAAGLAGVGALPGGLAGVGAQVVPQVVFAVEGSAAHLARVLGPGVAVAAALQHVSVQVVLPTELYVAFLAFVRFQT